MMGGAVVVIFALLLLPLLVLLLLPCRRLREEEVNEARARILAYIEEQKQQQQQQLMLTDNGGVDNDGDASAAAAAAASSREEELQAMAESVKRWGVVRMGLQCPDVHGMGLSRPDLHGMIDYEMKVLAFLEHGTASLLGISGKRGMGKSTLLRLVHTSTRHDSSFHYVFFVEAGIGFTADTLQGALARRVGIAPMPAVPTVNRISSFLRGESFILLLDDVRASFDLAAAGLPMPLGPRQKVVFTTRNESTCVEMGSAGNIVRMECLGKDVAWDLFRYKVGAKIIRPNSEIEDLAKEMVAECRGIPSAICTIGQSMANQKDVRHWRVAYEMLKIERPPLHEIEDTDDEGYPRLDFFEDELGDPFLWTH